MCCCTKTNVFACPPAQTCKDPGKESFGLVFGKLRVSFMFLRPSPPNIPSVIFHRQLGDLNCNPYGDDKKLCDFCIILFFVLDLCDYGALGVNIYWYYTETNLLTRSKPNPLARRWHARIHEDSRRKCFFTRSLSGVLRETRGTGAVYRGRELGYRGPTSNQRKWGMLGQDMLHTQSFLHI